ncbi:hypothetical protein [Candidatus Regiella insecticola]|uniref:hypothetical protein n=1 Tax=Candidatus Regiella insecticola TaxID=138073 RepID=UPI0005869B55|nr:hypothetical protein [Candidatus Regiella insecticola]
MNKHGQPIVSTFDDGSYENNKPTAILQGMQSENFIKNYKKYFQVFLALLENKSIPLSMQKKGRRDI